MAPLPAPLLLPPPLLLVVSPSWLATCHKGVRSKMGRGGCGAACGVLPADLAAPSCRLCPAAVTSARTPGCCCACSGAAAPPASSAQLLHHAAMKSMNDWMSATT
jgi:hypothetical protein